MNAFAWRLAIASNPPVEQVHRLWIWGSNSWLTCAVKPVACMREHPELKALWIKICCGC